METLKFIGIIFLVLLIFNLLIGVHELGHFLAARWRGLKIDRFAIWFGKPIWKRKYGGVEYALGWIPAGGYVALPQMATMEAIEGKSDSSEQPLPPISPLDKIIVAFAGPLFSFLLAAAFAVIVWQVGKPDGVSGDSTTIGWVDPNGPAAKAGLLPGDEIIEIDGFPVTHFMSPDEDSIKWRIITSEGTNIAVKYKRDGEVATAYPVPIKQETKWYQRKALRQILMDVEYPAVVGRVVTNSPADRAGLQPGDRIVAVNGDRIFSYYAILDAEQNSTNEGAGPVVMTIQRGGEQFQREMEPERPVKPANFPPTFGIAWQVDTNFALAHPTPGQQLKDSASQIFRTLGVLFSPKSDIGPQQLGGAVMIMRVYASLLDSEQGWRLVLWFSVVLNVNLALLNLLPLPVLDGGHIVLATIEGIRRRPVSARLLQYIQTGFAVLLIGFMLFLAFYDVGDWLRSSRGSKDQQIEFAPRP